MARRSGCGLVSALRYSRAEIEAAVEALSDADRFEEATRIVTTVAPSLQGVLASALEAGGWFEEAHQAQLSEAAALADPDERAARLRTVLAEETRISMMIGVAAGWALSEQLQDQRGSEEE